MVVKVGINGFGRIGRQVFKTIYGGYEEELQIVAVNDLMDLHTIAHLYKYDSTYGISEEEIEVNDRDLIVDGNPVHVFSERDPGNIAVARLRRGHRHRIHRLLHGRDQGEGAHEWRREEGHHLRPRHERGHHARPRRQSGEVRPGAAPCHLQRLLHDELHRADREGAHGKLRHRQGHDGDGAFLHERSGAARRPAQGPPPRPQPPGRISSRRRPAPPARSRSSSRN